MKNALAAIIIRRNEPIPPFGEPARDILVLNETLADYQDQLFATMGATTNRIEEGAHVDVSSATRTVVFDENLYFSAEFLESFLDKAAGQQQARACLAPCTFAKQLAVLHGFPLREDGSIPFPLYLCRGDSFSPSTAVDIVIDVDERFEEGHFPKHMLGKDNFRYAVTTRPILVVNEPLHIGLLNIAANFARLARLWRPGVIPGLKALWAIISAFSLDKTTLKARALRALSRIDPTALIHPTAVIEGSVIGPRAKVGAYAVVRGSVIAADAVIDDHAGIKFSVIGSGAYIANNNVIFFSTVYPGAFLISGPYQFCVFGRDSAIMNSIPTDYRLDGKTHNVMTRRGLEDTGLRFAGSIIGHRTRIAAGLIFAPGRAIPNGLTLYPDPARVMTRMPTELPEDTVWFLINGQLTDKP